MARRRLRRRYGRSGGHLPRSRLSLDVYQRELGHALHYLKLGAVLKTEEERMLELNGWRDGKKPITVAIAIEKLRIRSRRQR